MGRLPDFLIIGAMRAGTTSLTRYLDAHSQVRMSSPKEIHFFDRHFDRGVDWYTSHFRGAAGDVTVGEATPMYSYSRRAVTRMAEVVPDAKLVLLLRNPVDRAYSHYCHNRQRLRDRLSFEEAIAAEPSRLSGADGFRFAYLDRGRYVPQIDRVLEHYPREALHLDVFEHLVAEPVETFGRVCRFLGVDAGERPANLGAQTNMPLAFRSVRVRDWSRRLPGGLRDAVARLNSKPVQNPPMDPGTRASLADLFADQRAELERRFSLDLRAWQRGVAR